ncbi:hypothetical protein F4810DRAFT_408189 [Camillea tinctor]|nr:hypothetical protein F4810DRAFT_408189 [Camillea tinctor]
MNPARACPDDLSLLLLPSSLLLPSVYTSFFRRELSRYHCYYYLHDTVPERRELGFPWRNVAFACTRLMNSSRDESHETENLRTRGPAGGAIRYVVFRNTRPIQTGVEIDIVEI